MDGVCWSWWSGGVLESVEGCSHSFFGGQKNETKDENEDD